MKKLITLLFLLISFSIYSQNYVDFKATDVMVTINNETTTQEVDLNIRVYADKNRIVVYTEPPQIIDYEVDRKYTDDDGYGWIEGFATDTKYKKIYLMTGLHVERQHLIVIISYNNLTYGYSAYIDNRLSAF